ncbi:MAG: hypothetical protein JWQ36_324 [Enterovirga sp.]|nr:hypothetical protein [Enterovirga sp.]
MVGEFALQKKAQLAAAEIRKIVKAQLDDCHRAIKAGTRSIALYELEDASRKLKQIADVLEK